MKIQSVSVTEYGVQVIVETSYPSRFAIPDKVITPAHAGWPRLKAAGVQLKTLMPELDGFELTRVDQQAYRGG